MVNVELNLTEVIGRRSEITKRKAFARSVDPDQQVHPRSLILICSVCLNVVVALCMYFVKELTIFT